MSNQQIPQRSGSDEIDLGQLFLLIGRGFSKFFDFIKTIFKGLFDILILVLLFIQKHFIKFVISGIIGLTVGFFLDTYLPEKYVSKMVVEPNFNSVQQLYNNIDFYNDLARAQDSITLGSVLSISVSDAATIKKIFVDSYSDENQKIKLFDTFIRELDTSTVKVIEYKSYLENFNSLDARFHQISVISTNSYVAKRMQPTIIQSISANNYFKLQKSINDENIQLQDSIYKQQLSEIDSLQKLYKEVLIKEADKPLQGTNISLADKGSTHNKELELVKERDVLKERLVKLNDERANKSAILNIISDFPVRGVKEKGLLKSYKFLLPLAMLGIVLVILFLIEINKFLKNYSVKPTSESIN